MALVVAFAAGLLWACEKKEHGSLSPDDPRFQPADDVALPTRTDPGFSPIKDPADALAPLSDRPGLRLPIPDNLVTMLPGEMPQIQECIRQTIATGRPISSFQPVLLAVLDRLTIKPTDVIADIGGGSGVLEIALLEKKIPFAKAYTVDIDAPSIELLSFMLEETAYEGREKIVPVVSDMTDVKLPPNAIDVAVFVRANFINAVVDDDGKLHATPGTLALLKTVATALKPGGRVEYFFMEQQRTVDDHGKAIDRGDEAVIVPFAEAGIRFVSRTSYKMSGGAPFAHFSFVKDAKTL